MGTMIEKAHEIYRMNQKPPSPYAIIGEKPSPYIAQHWKIFDPRTGAWLLPDGHFGYQEHNAEIFRDLAEARERVAELDREDYRRAHPDADKNAKGKIIDHPRPGWLPVICAVLLILLACWAVKTAAGW
jgi:hypothetical protein